MKKSLLVLLVLVLAFSFVGCGGNQQQPQQTQQTQQTSSSGSEEQKVTLKITSAWNEGNSNLDKFNDFVEKVKQKTDGTVTIEWGGGPEAIPSYQLVEALRNGVVDIAWTAHTYNVSHVPAAEAMKLTDAATMRETGGFDFMYDYYKEKLNVHYIAHTSDGLTYNLYTKDKIETLEDFKGKTIRATPAYQAFVEGLGAGVVNTPPGEAYQALERNVIQGYGWPSVGITDFGWQEVSQYIIQPAFYNVDVSLFMSDKAWNKLSEKQQQAIMEAGHEIEQESKTYWQQQIADEKAVLIEQGMEELQLADDVAKEYLKLAYEKGWANALKLDEENVKKLQEFTRYNN